MSYTGSAGNELPGSNYSGYAAHGETLHVIENSNLILNNLLYLLNSFLSTPLLVKNFFSEQSFVQTLRPYLKLNGTLLTVAWPPPLLFYDLSKNPLISFKFLTLFDKILQLTFSIPLVLVSWT